MSEKTIEEKVKDIIVDQLGVNAEQVVLDAKFIEDLGADSLDTVELVMAFEEELVASRIFFQPEKRHRTSHSIRRIFGAVVPQHVESQSRSRDHHRMPGQAHLQQPYEFHALLLRALAGKYCQMSVSKKEQEKILGYSGT